MNPEIKKEWVEALRSGKYRQCRGKLKDESGAMCCLGVLRDVVNPGDESSEGNTNLMPTVSLMKSVGLHTWAIYSVIRMTLAAEYYSELNDQGKSFAEIADEIEKNL